MGLRVFNFRAEDMRVLSRGMHFPTIWMCVFANYYSSSIFNQLFFSVLPEPGASRTLVFSRTTPPPQIITKYFVILVFQKHLDDR